MSYEQTNLDQLYIEDGYFDTDGYLVYIAEAEGLLADYIDAGYIDPYYYLGRGAEATLTADLTEFTGVTVEASGSFTSQGSLSVTVTRNRFGSSAMSAVATVTAQGFRTQEIVLSAFSNASTATNASVIRSANTALSSTVTQSTTAARLRDTAVTLTSAFTTTVTASSIALTAQANLTSVGTFTVDAVANRSASITLTSIVTQSLTADRLRDVTANIAGSFTKSATAVKTTTTSAALSSQASTTTEITRIKDFTASFTAAFAPTMTVVAVRNAFAVLDSVVTVSAAAVATKVTTAAVSSSASQAVTLTIFRNVDAALSSQSALSVTAVVTKEVVSAVSGAATVVAANSRIRSSAVAFTSAFSPTLSVDVFRNSFAVLDSNASLNFVGVVQRSILANLNSQASINANVGKLLTGSGNLAAYSGLFISRHMTTNRPALLSGGALPISFSSSVKKYGSHSLSLDNTGSEVVFIYANNDIAIPANNDFLIELWVRPNGNTLASNDNTLLLGVGDMTTLANMNANDSWGIGWGGPTGSFKNRLRFKFATASNTFTTIETPEPGYSPNTWNHIVVTRKGSTIYVWNNTTGNYAFATYSGAIFQGTVKKLKIRNSFSYTSSSSQTLYVDEVYLKVNYSPEFADFAGLAGDAFTAPVVNDPEKTKFLYHFDNNLNDDVAVTFSGTAALSSVSSVTATITGPQRVTASLSSQSSVTAAIGKINEINLTAFSNANLSAVVTRIKTSDVSLDSAASLSNQITVIKPSTAALSSEASVSASILRIKDFSSNFAAIASELVIGDKSRNVTANLTSEFSTTRRYIDYDYLDPDYYEVFEVSAVKTASGVVAVNAVVTLLAIANQTATVSASLSSAATLAVIGSRVRFGAGSFSSQVTVSTETVKTVSANSSMQAVATMVPTTKGIISISAALSASASQTSNVSRTRLFSAALTSTVSQSSVITKTVDYSADLSASASLAIPGERIRPVAVTTDAIFTELTAVAKIGDFLVSLEVPASLVADCSIIAENVITTNLLTQIATVAVKTAVVNSNLTAISSSSIEGTTNIIAQADLVSNFAVTCDIDLVAGAIALVASAGTMSVTALRKKSLSAALTVAGAELVLGSRITQATAALTAVSTVSANVTKIVNLTANLTGFAATVSVIDIIHIDAKLTWMIVAEDRTGLIQSENRDYSIIEEDRDYLIVAENREYAVFNELLTTQLQGP